MELVAIITLSSITWLSFRLVPKNRQPGIHSWPWWICYGWPFVASAALYGCLYSALTLHFTFAQDFTFGQADTTAFRVYSMLIRFFNLSYIPLTGLCVVSCLVQLYCMGAVRFAPTRNRVWLGWSLLASSALTAALAMGYLW